MFSHLSPLLRSERGITGLETAIILIAFVVVASVFAFTVLSTGVFSSERAKETIFAGLEDAQSSMSPRGAIIAYTGVLSDSTSTVFKMTFDLALSLNGQPIDLTAPFTADGSGTDPDVVTNPGQVTVIDYIDKNQTFPDVPWSVTFPGQDDGDSILEINERAEITVWLLNRETGTAIGTAGSVAYQTTEGGITSTDTVLTKNYQFTVLIKPPKGATLNLTRTLPSSLDTVMNLN